MRMIFTGMLLVVAQIITAQPPHINSFSPFIIGNYQNVTIKGQRFTNANRVTFGGIPALSFWVMNDTSIIATVGQGNSGFVAVRSPAGTDSLAGLTVVGDLKILSYSPTAAGQGDTVVVNGKNFTGIQEVNFGDSAASSFQVPNDSTIRAVVGSGSNGKLYVYGNYGEDSASGFQYQGPSILSFSPTSGGAGIAVQIKGKNLSGTISISFGGNAAASFNVVSDSLLSATVGAGGPGDVRVVTNHGVAVAPGFIVPVIRSFLSSAATRFDSVYIRGYNFFGTTAVSFGDTAAANFRVLSDTVLLALPGNGGNGKVKVSKDTIAGFSGQSLYYIPYRPRIFSFSPVIGTSQTMVTITGTQFIGTTEVRFGNR